MSDTVDDIEMYSDLAQDYLERKTFMSAVKEREVSRRVALPTKKNTPPQNLIDSIILIYGRKSIGKTSLAAEFDDPFVTMFERGRRNLNILMVPEEGEPKLDWSTFREYVNLFLESDLRTLVIDTAEKAYEACMSYVSRLGGKEHPSDFNDFGKTWSRVETEFDDLLGQVKESGKGLVLLSHEIPKPLTKTTKGMRREDAEVSTLERMQPSLPNGAFKVVQEVCDYVFYYGYRDEHRVITVRSPNDLYWTACGLDECFLDPEGNPISSFKVGNSAKEAYKNLLDAHSNKLFDYDYEPPREKLVLKKKGE